MNTVMTIGETAAYLRLSENSIYRLVQDGTLPAARIGRTWRVSREALDQWLTERMLDNLPKKEETEC